MPEKKVGRMGQAINWQGEISDIAGPFDGNRKGWLARAARKADVSYRQIKALYYGEILDPKHSVATGVLTAAEQARIDETRRNASEVAQYLARYAEGLAAVDENFHSEQINAALAIAREISSRNRA